MDYLQPYLIAIFIGLLVGIERERAHPLQKVMGVRTFLLISLLGAISGGINSVWLSAIITAFALGLIFISYFTQTHSKPNQTDPGLTTEFAAGIVFCLGYTAHLNPALSALAGPLVAVILFSKTSLHRFTQEIQASELKAALLLLLAGVALVNLVPDKVIDPWGVMNPRKFGYIVLTLATLEFSSYVLAKLIGNKKGNIIVGFLGGLISSTAVLFSSARKSKEVPESWRSQMNSALAAKLASIAELLLIVGLISPSLLAKVLIPSSAALFYGFGALLLSARKEKDGATELVLKSPLNWLEALRLSLILATILGIISVTESLLGENATFLVSFVTGLFELHGVSLASATMLTQNLLSMNTAMISILLAVIASMVAKIALAWGIGANRFARSLTVVFVPMIFLVAGAIWLTLF